MSLTYVFGNPRSAEKELALRKDSAANHISELAATSYSDYNEHQRGWLERAETDVKRQVCNEAAAQQPPNTEVLFALAGIVAAQHRECASHVRTLRQENITDLDDMFRGVQELKTLETHILDSVRTIKNRDQYSEASPSYNLDDGCYILY